MNEIICYCKQDTKSEIEKAVSEGAKNLKDIHTSGKCCSSDINTMLPKPKFKLASTCGCGNC